MKLIQTVEAEGAVLCHDITQIVRGVTKGAIFRKGHVVAKEDIPVLLSIGKDRLYVWEREEGMLHENDAAEILCAMCKGRHMEQSQAKEGKIELRAACDGLLKVDDKGLKAINGFGQMMIATRHGNFPVKKGDKLAGTRIIPLIIEAERMEAAKKAAEQATGGLPILDLKPFVHKKVGIITTGNEVYYGRIQDTFTPVIEEKMKEFDTELMDHAIWNDDDTKITASILDMIEKGADVVVCTGGMSVDPDDKTPLAIRNTGAQIVSYGAPVLPGAMFLLAYYQAKERDNPRTVAIMGLPGCVMYAKRTIFDLALPRVMADDKITSEELAALGQGGLCLDCPVCTFPNCGFGKGV
ncbi:MAG: molybdopterin-binding protein [Clostridiaceae bacterium]|uniref:Molybdopterin molybdenumtransferase n=1 Tax=Clostridium porci TaxID=2605778 RepID=A0A7X2NIK0_9CLOT|nr:MULTISPECIES: molybdopterin-binding protein [Clostridium]MCI6138972.1 molybdopterin-binding protein [Clostridium sp.]MDY3231189.1 molybdopterin-binding protein [Clostridiaceae bacterium]MSS35569.1 molybdopterin-binding protein [Clostridium porci]